MSDVRLGQIPLEYQVLFRLRLGTPGAACLALPGCVRSHNNMAGAGRRGLFRSRTMGGRRASLGLA